MRSPKPKSVPDADARAAIQARFSGRFAFVGLRAENFFQHLPTRAERRAFALEFPERFLEIFGFIAHDTDAPEYAAVLPRAAGACVFRRPLEFFDGLPFENFEPPDLRAVEGVDRQHQLMAAARGAWWRENGLEMSREEKKWTLPQEEKCPKISPIKSSN